MYKLVAIDMDGTLLKNDHSISEEVKETIKSANEKGVKVVLATGRPLNGVTAYLKELNLLKEDDYVLSYNGGLIQKTLSGEIVSQILMPIGSFNELYSLSLEVGVHIHLLTSKAVITPNRDISIYTSTESYINSMPIWYRTPEEIEDISEICKIMLIDHPEVLEEAVTKLPSWLYEKYNVVRSSPYFLEILPKGVGKGTGIKLLGEKLGIKREEIIAIGDAGNDLDMIKYAGLGVAMDNAFDFIKEEADFITKSNEEDGVAHVINKFILDIDEDELAG